MNDVLHECMKMSLFSYICRVAYGNSFRLESVKYVNTMQAIFEVSYEAIMRAFFRY